MHYKRRSRRNPKTKMLSCGCCEARWADKEPIEDGPCTGKVRSKRQATTKAKCPVNGTHEWYREVIRRSDYFGSHEARVSTCIHCWEVKEVRLPGVDWWRVSDRRKLVLPKREVKF